jgi:hypothetical protein
VYSLDKNQIGYPQSFPPTMKLKAEQLEQVAALIIAGYKTKDLIVAKASDTAVKAKIIESIAKNFAEEEIIEDEARKMLATVARASRDMDPFKMFLLAKQKLAAKKGFIL